MLIWAFVIKPHGGFKIKMITKNQKEFWQLQSNDDTVQICYQGIQLYEIEPVQTQSNFQTQFKFRVLAKLRREDKKNILPCPSQTVSDTHYSTEST